jgi:hypothetical protein
VKRVPRLLTGGQVVGYEPLPGDRPRAPRLLTGGSIVEEQEEPGLAEAAGRGLLSGVTFDFDDEIGAALGSAFSDRKYKELRDELRAKKAAAQEAHPWGYGLASALGTVGTGLVTGGLAAGAKTVGGVAKLAAAESALQAAGNSTADLTEGDVGGLVKDTAVGGAVGGVIGAGLHKALGAYAATAPLRRAQHLGEDIAEGAIPTAKRRLGQVLEVNEKTGHSLAVDVLDSDPEFTKALGKGQAQARVVAQQRLEGLGKEVTPIYKGLDRETGGVPLGHVVERMDEMVAGADKPGNAQVHAALEEARNQFVGSYRRKLDIDPTADLNSINIPTQDVREWVTRLKKQATTSMGSLSETERKVVKDEVHRATNVILNDHLDNVARSLPELAPDIAALREANKKILVYSLADDTLKNAVQRKAWSPSSFSETLSKTFLPVAAGAIGAGADVVTGGLAYGGTKLALKAGAKAHRGATKLLNQLVQAARSGNATSKMALDAITGGVPAALVNTIMSGVGQPLALAAGNAAVEAAGSVGRGRGGSDFEAEE